MGNDPSCGLVAKSKGRSSRLLGWSCHRWHASSQLV